MREKIAEALKLALKSQDKRSVSTLRLILAAIHDRDIANRSAGKEPVSEEDIVAVLSKMVKQREDSARLFDEGGRPELAAQEREEIEIVQRFLPKQMSEAEVKAASQKVVAEVGAEGLRDIGRVMSALKARYPGQMDFGKASAIVKGLLQ